EEAAAVGGRIETGELVGRAKAADRGGSTGGSDPHGGAEHDSPAPPDPQQASGEVDVDRDRVPGHLHVPATNVPIHAVSQIRRDHLEPPTACGDTRQRLPRAKLRSAGDRRRDLRRPWCRVKLHAALLQPGDLAAVPQRCTTTYRPTRGGEDCGNRGRYRTRSVGGIAAAHSAVRYL